MEDKVAFKNYFDKFDINDKNMLLKYNHSIRTMKVCKEIGKSIGLNFNDLKLIEQIGLLHDIGRFNQLEEYYSFSDKNMDHAEEGIRILFEENEINNFDINKEDYEIVKIAIQNHNKYKIKEGLNDREILFANLIRDCDKLEILYRVGIEDLLIAQENEIISQEVEKQFFDEEPIKIVNCKNGNDKIILMLAYIYDINFKETYIYLKKEEIYKKIFDLIKDKEKFKKYFDKVYKYIDLKIKED